MGTILAIFLGLAVAGGVVLGVRRLTHRQVTREQVKATVLTLGILFLVGVGVVLATN